MKRLFVILAGLLVGLVGTAPVLATAAPHTAAPKTAGAQIAVFAADGTTPIGDTAVHPGDELVVRGSDFDPNANRTGGLPLPVPPGVPHGTFIAFGAFAPVWQPSKGAPESSRGVNRPTMKWAMSADALRQVPDVPFDLRRTIRLQWVQLNNDGTFVARIKANTPKKLPANARYGVYTYGAADVANAAQERFVPVNYSTTPGPNTPKPARANLIWAYAPNFAGRVTTQTQGALSGSDGAAVDKQGRMTFELKQNTVRNGNGVLSYRGTVVASTRFHLIEFAMADPRIVVRNGHGVLSMRTSTTNMNGDDAMRRIDIADVDLRAANAAGDVTNAPVTFRPGIAPQALALLSTGPAAPLTLRS